MLGGMLEYASLITGYRALLIVAGLIYLLAFLLRPARVVPAPAAP